MRWSEAMTLEFVKIYLKHECLWNPNHPGYKIKYHRDKAYSEICSEFKHMKSLLIPEVKMKIKNLRTTYIQQVHKILEKSSPDCIYEPSLVWFHEMDQCLKHIPINRHSTSFPTQETLDVDSCVWTDQGAENNHDDANPDPLISNSEDDFDSLKTEELNSVKKQKSVSSLPKKKTKRKKFKYRSLPHSFSKDSNFESIKEDEFDIYGKYIASQLRSMDLQKVLRLQLEIQSLVSEARMSELNSD